MYCTGRMQVDGFDYPIMRCKISIPGPKINQVGTVLAPPPAPSFTIKIESRRETNLFRWLSEIQIKSHVKLQFSSVNMDGQSKTFDLYDVRCISNQESFSFDGDAPMANTLTLIPGILIAEGVLLRSQNWKIQDPAVIMGQVEPKVIEKAKEGKMLSHHLENELGEKIDKCKRNQTVYLVIKSEEMVGKSICIDLSDDDIDYEYQGTYLENDFLDNISVTGNMMKIELKTLKQR